MMLKYSQIADKGRWSLPLGNDHGFTLMGAMMGLAIFVIGILAVLSMQAMTVNSTGRSTRITETNSWAQDMIETLITLPYDDPDLEPDYAIGAEIDPLEQVDWENGNFLAGLIHSQTEGPYTLKWVVFTSANNGMAIEDFANLKSDPMFADVNRTQKLKDIPPNTKLITIQVTHPSGQSSHFVYVKANI